jgi:hypothetical protein
VSGALALRSAVAVLLLVGGAAVGTASVLVHAYAWGLGLAAVAAAATLVALPPGWWRRLPFALGWCLALAVLSTIRPGGDILVPSTLDGYLLLGLGVAVLLGGVVGLVTYDDAQPASAETEAPTS